MADYTREIALALRLIEKKGGLFTVSRSQQSVPDSDKPWRKIENAFSVPLEFTATGVMTQFKRSQQSQGFTAGSEDTRYALPGDMFLYLAPGNPDITFTPTARDIVQRPVDGATERYGVVDNKILSPDGESLILFKLWLRK